MKKRMYISIGAIIAVLAAVLGASYLLSFHKVSLTLQKEVNGVTIYRSDKQKVKHLTADGNILLQAGKYHLVPEGNDISQDAIDFTVNNSDMIISVDPSYTKKHLSDLLEQEKSAIGAAIALRYPSIITGYSLKQETLYKKGEWFGALLAPIVSDPRDQKDPYRIVLHKKDGTWEVIRRPEYILTSSKYPDVPSDILRAINKLI